MYYKVSYQQHLTAVCPPPTTTPAPIVKEEVSRFIIVSQLSIAGYYCDISYIFMGSWAIDPNSLKRILAEYRCL